MRHNDNIDIVTFVVYYIRTEEVIDMSEQRWVAVFIDWVNVFRNVNVDLIKFREFLESLGVIHVVYAYMVDFSDLQKKDDPPEARRSPDGFWRLMRKQDFRLRIKKIKVITREGEKDLHKANWDVGMTIDILKTAQSGKVDEIILFSGDGDFDPLIEEIQNPPCLIKVTVVARGKNTASELRHRADRFIDMEGHLHKFSRPFEGRPHRETVEEAAHAPAPDPVPVQDSAEAETETVLEP